jgi:DNA (cytosine-5)-methyltransferase 1
MTALYVDIDPHACEWLRNLISAGVIAPGDVWLRDIRDIAPNELIHYDQCHFFAGIGVWSYALRLARWSDDRRVWTGSCPCQPFSAAGRGGGFADERHLWPAWQWLIEQCRPDTIFGEQVASKDGLAWFDLVLSDLEGSNYAVGVSDSCAAGVGSPNVRQRLFFVADACHERRERERLQLFTGQSRDAMLEASGSRGASELADSESIRLLGRQDDGDGGRRERASGQGCEAGELGDAACDRQWERRELDTGARCEVSLGGSSVPSELADAGGERLEVLGEQPSRGQCTPTERGGAFDRPGPTNGYWRDADWLFCTDGKWRAVSAGSFPLVDGAAFRLGSGGPFEGKSRAGMLKGYGNAINAEVAAEFIRAFIDYDLAKEWRRMVEGLHG